MTKKHREERLHLVLKKPKHFMRFWNVEIRCKDNRSKISAAQGAFLGKVIGIKLDSVLLRTRNEITDWYPLNNSEVEFFTK